MTSFALATVFLGLGYLDTQPASLGKLIDYSDAVTMLKVEKSDAESGAVKFALVKVLKRTKDKAGESAFAGTQVHVLSKNVPGGKQLYTKLAADQVVVAFYCHVPYILGGKVDPQRERACAYVYLDGLWYVVFANLEQGPQFHLMRTDSAYLSRYSGTVDDLATAVVKVLDGKEVLVTCRSGAAKQTSPFIDPRITKVEVKDGTIRMRVGRKILDYDPDRDAVPNDK